MKSVAWLLAVVAGLIILVILILFMLFFKTGYMNPFLAILRTFENT